MEQAIEVEDFSITFIDLSGCSEEDQKILSRTLSESTYRPALPWSDEEDQPIVLSSSQQTHQYTSFHNGEVTRSSAPNSDFFYTESSDGQQVVPDAGVDDDTVSKAIKSKERRNKKKRPADYYEKLETQTDGATCTADTFRDSVINVNSNNYMQEQGTMPEGYRNHTIGGASSIKTNQSLPSNENEFSYLTNANRGFSQQTTEDLSFKMNACTLYADRMNPCFVNQQPFNTIVQSNPVGIPYQSTVYQHSAEEAMIDKSVDKPLVHGPYTDVYQSDNASKIDGDSRVINKTVINQQTAEDCMVSTSQPVQNILSNENKQPSVSMQCAAEPTTMSNYGVQQERLLRSGGEITKPQCNSLADSNKAVHISSVSITLKEPSDKIFQAQTDIKTVGSDDAIKDAAKGDCGIDSSATASPSDSIIAESSASTNTATTQSKVEPVAQNIPAAKPTSWASLFKGAPSPASRGGQVVFSQNIESSTAACSTPPNSNDSEDIPTVSAGDDKNAKSLGVILCKFNAQHRGSPLQPRGLINKANWCYINATLQALLACPPFYHLFKSLPVYSVSARGPSSTPVTDCLIEFVNEFKHFTQLKVVEKEGTGRHKHVQDISTGAPFEPLYVYKMLDKIKSSSTFKLGKQEDAEEFLSCVLNGLHEEMCSALALLKPENELQNGEVHDIDGESEEIVEEEGSDEWEQVGPKKKSVVTRSASFTLSPISEIFCGQTRSVLSQLGAKESATLQPFFTLQLDIQADGVFSVLDALNHLVSKESLQGYTCSKTKQEVAATRKMTLEHLPPVLILHSKCFVYDKNGGSQKLVKQLHYDIDLEIGKELLTASVKSKLSLNQRTYKLFAVVYHQGKKVTGGHYITDVYHGGINGWVRYDDGNVSVISQQTMLKFAPPRVPYLLYYRRFDLIKGRT